MPIYEYQCKNCGHQLEAFQKISEEPLSICPQCQTSNLNKLISSTSFQLKGTGWYATDFKDKGKPKKNSSGEGGESGGSSSESNGTSSDAPKKDTKPNDNAAV